MGDAGGRGVRRPFPLSLRRGDPSAVAVSVRPAVCPGLLNPLLLVSTAAGSEYEGMAQVTTDHDEIRRWVEERGGRPARVRGTGSNGDPGILRIDFDEPGGDDDEQLEEIDWNEWFRAFDENRLAFLYEPEAGSRFNKLVSRENVEVG
jgi:hypothetical protein